ncbi:MAG: ABC transporter ATP-binding protein [Actinomycetota bacterium]
MPNTDVGGGAGGPVDDASPHPSPLDSAREDGALEAAETDSDDASAIGIRQLLAPVAPHLAVACVLRAVSAVIGLFPFLAVAWVAEALLEDPIDRDGAWRAVWLGVGALGVSVLTLLLALSITHLADIGFQHGLRVRMARHVGRVPLGWFNDRTSGGLTKSLQDDVSNMHHLVGHAAVDFVAAAVTPIATVIILLVIDWRLALFTLVPVVLGLFLYGRQMANYGDQMKAYQDSLGRVNSAVIEFLSGISVVKTFGRTEEAHGRYTEETEGFADLFYSWVRDLLRLANITELALSPLFAVIWILSGSIAFVAAGAIEPVDALPFLVLGAGITSPINALGFAANDMQTAVRSANNVGELLGTPTLSAAAEFQDPVDATVGYEGVSFSYDGTSMVLQDVDLTLVPGTVTAVVGPSGSGKSTIARLLPRFWDPVEGSVSIGGVDLRDLDPDELYRRVGFVFQEVQLLRASVADNIALGRPDAGRDEIERAAVAARIHDRLLELPDGYDTVVGDDTSFSGGEAQRISIARMILADTPILVLDEATAFADPEAEADIQDALSELAVGRTVLVIAHRLGTIVDADQILVVDGGRIVDRGGHDDLLTTSDLYRRLWDAYGGAGGPALATGSTDSREVQA